VDRIFLTLAGLFGLGGVAAGAFGTHALRAKVPPERLAAFETGARYLLFGAFSMFAVEWFRAAGPDQVAESWAGVCLAVGTVVFSGSLGALTLTARRGWGAVTPVGGVLLLAGWSLLVVAALTAPIAFDRFP
jgi:uncharacterized membrane protein YgdD (TMEM256/DUF423 family)